MYAYELFQKSRYFPDMLTNVEQTQLDLLTQNTKIVQVGNNFGRTNTEFYPRVGTDSVLLALPNWMDEDLPL